MKPVGIPIVATPSRNQVDGEDKAPAYPVLPKEMHTYTPPVLPEQRELARAPRTIAVLHELLQCVERTRGDTSNRAVDVSDLDTPECEMLAQLLGEGEVSIRVQGGDEWMIQESGFVGLWRVRQPATGIDRIEVGRIPDAVLTDGLSGASPRLEFDPGAAPAGTVNAPSLLVELAAKQAEWRVGMNPHVINLTLLPHSPQDLDYLNAILGQGRTQALSRGYGNCRVTATGVSHIWWVQYYNSVDTLILNTLEVVDVPAVVPAAREDIEDTAVRLREVLELLRCGRQ